MSIGWATFAAADLRIVDLTIDPASPLPGADVLLTATVENVGDMDVEEQFFVRFEADGRLIENPATSGGLRAGRQKAVTALWIAEEGEHALTVEADQPFDRIRESNESNNAARIVVVVPSAGEIAGRLRGLRLVVGPFEDRSGSGLVNVEDGVADKLSERLSEAGARVIDIDKLEDIMRRRGLNPYALSEAGIAAEELGADVLITGSIAGINTFEATLSLGIVSFGGGSAEVSLTAAVFAVPGTECLFEVTAAGRYEGPTELALDLGSILSDGATTDVCAGDVRTDRDGYYGGELVSIGYVNAGPPTWFSAEVHTSTGTFVRWLGWQYAATGDCGRWFWDQCDSYGVQVPASVYVAKIWNGTSYIASTSFQIRPGVTLFPLVEEITVGSESFENSIVGGAVNRAVDRLVSTLIGSLETIAMRSRSDAVERAAAEASVGPATSGQVAAILPNGRIVITLGASSGAAQGDLYEVVDPETWAIRGEIVIVEVRDDVSYALSTGDVDPAVGDFVRPIDP